ncbi:MAG: hypothetical protein ACYS1A_13265 [Planctomycetota bacterium]
MKKLIILLIFLLFPGCNGAEQLGKRWLGLHKMTLVAIRGVPTKIVSDEHGGEVYIYTRTDFIQFPHDIGYTYTPKEPYIRREDAYREVYGRFPEHYIAGVNKEIFWINPLGKIYRVRAVYEHQR